MAQNFFLGLFWGPEAFPIGFRVLPPLEPPQLETTNFLILYNKKKKKIFFFFEKSAQTYGKLIFRLFNENDTKKNFLKKFKKKIFFPIEKKNFFSL
jgi:hypothetical protein